MKKLIAALSICLMLLLGVCVALRFCEGVAPQPTETQPAITYTVRFEMADTVCSEQVLEQGQLPAPVTAQIPGLIFREWVDENGVAVDPFSQQVTGDQTYQALYYPALSGGVPYPVSYTHLTLPTMAVV